MQSRKKIQKLAPEELFNHAVKLLSIRSHSSDELRAKLRLRANSPADVDPVIARLKDIGYLNDERFAENFATARRENEGFGKFRVLLDLRKRRIGAELARQVVEHAFEGAGEDELIANFIERRMPSVQAGGIEDERQLATAYRKLRRAGFSSGKIITALKAHAARPDALEEPPAEDLEDEEGGSD